MRKETLALRCKYLYYRLTFVIVKCKVDQPVAGLEDVKKIVKEV